MRLQFTAIATVSLAPPSPSTSDCIPAESAMHPSRASQAAHMALCGVTLQEHHDAALWRQDPITRREVSLASADIDEVPRPNLSVGSQTDLSTLSGGRRVGSSSLMTSKLVLANPQQRRCFQTPASSRLYRGAYLLYNVNSANLVVHLPLRLSWLTAPLPTVDPSVHPEPCRSGGRSWRPSCSG